MQQRQVRGLMVQKTVVLPQLQSIACRRLSLLAVEADPHGPDCSADHRDSPVAVRFLVVDPCCAGREDSPVPQSAVSVHRWSSIFLSWCSGPMVLLFSRPW